jgi:undecaprenyl-phosphate 4-deoxy-4-formamido-L-arabinose transferase
MPESMSRTEPPDLSVVIPVYNEEQGLPSLFERLGAFCQSLTETTTEILFVDDHSTDRTAALLAQACRENPAYRFIRLSANRGSHVAIFAGLEHSRGRCAVFLAADLQDPPELIPKMLDLWREGLKSSGPVRDEPRDRLV